MLGKRKGKTKHAKQIDRFFLFFFMLWNIHHVHGCIVKWGKRVLRKWLVILLVMMGAWFTLHDHLFNEKRKKGTRGGKEELAVVVFLLLLRCSRSHCFFCSFFFLSCARMLIAPFAVVAVVAVCCRFAPFGLLGMEEAEMCNWCLCVCVWLLVGRCRFSQSRLSSLCSCCSHASNRSRLSKPKINSMQITQPLSQRSTSPHAHSLSLVHSARQPGMYVGDILGQPYALPDTHSHTHSHKRLSWMSHQMKWW